MWYGCLLTRNQFYAVAAAAFYGAIIVKTATFVGAQASAEPQNPPAAPPQGAPPAAQGAGPAQGPPGEGRPGGGGRGGAIAMIYDQMCAGCHGTTDGKAGRAPSLFDEKWLNGTTDLNISKAIRTGVPNTEMGAFPATQLSDDQIFQLTAFIRTQAGRLKPRPVFVPEADGTLLSTEKQTVKVEVLTKDVDTPWGLAFLPDGRLLITERPGRLRIYDKGKLSEPIKGAPKPHVQQDGGYLDVSVHPQYATEWMDLSVVFGSAAGLRAASRVDAGVRGCASRGTRRGSRGRSRRSGRSRPWRARSRPRWAAAAAVEHRDRPRQDQQEQ